MEACKLQYTGRANISLLTSNIRKTDEISFVLVQNENEYDDACGFVDNLNILYPNTVTRISSIISEDLYAKMIDKLCHY